MVLGPGCTGSTVGGGWGTSGHCLLVHVPVRLFVLPPRPVRAAPSPSPPLPSAPPAPAPRSTLASLRASRVQEGEGPSSPPPAQRSGVRRSSSGLSPSSPQDRPLPSSQQQHHPCSARPAWADRSPSPASPSVSCPHPCSPAPGVTFMGHLHPRPCPRQSPTVTFRASKPGCTGTSSGLFWAPARPRLRVSSRRGRLPKAMTAVPQRKESPGSPCPFLVPVPRGHLLSQPAPPGGFWNHSHGDDGLSATCLASIGAKGGVWPGAEAARAV